MTTPAPTAIRIKRHSTKAKDGDAKAQQAPAARLKVVVRHLPSSLKENEFREAMKDVINDNTIEYFSWISGKVPADRNKASVPSRCYIKVKSPEDLNALSNALRNHGTFTDSKGITTTPHMEFAPFQKVPKKTQRADARAGTIENDVEFQAFLAALMTTPAKQEESVPATEDKVEGDEKPSLTAAPQLDLNAPAPIPANDPLSVPLPSNEVIEKPKTTPLIESIRAQKQAAAEKSAKSKAERAATAAPSSTSAESGSSRSSKRAERRARERAAKGQEKKEAPAPTALLKRADSGIAPPRTPKQATTPQTGGKTAEKAAEKAAEKEKNEKQKEEEKEKPKPRDRRPRGAAGVAAILQRDLGLGGPSTRRGRAKQQAAAAAGSSTEPEKSKESTTSESTKPPADTPSTPTTSTPAPDALSAASTRSPAKPRERPSRRERRAARLEREESAAAAAAAGPSPSAPPTLLKKQAPSNSAEPSSPAIPALLKRETSTATDSGPSASTAAKSTPAKSAPPPTPAGPAQSPAPNPPTGPRGGGFVRGGRGRGGMRGSINLPVGQAAPAPGPPTGPSAEVARGRGRGRGPIFRGPRGRGGGPALRGGGSAAPSGPSAPSGPAA